MATPQERLQQLRQKKRLAELRAMRDQTGGGQQNLINIQDLLSQQAQGQQGLQPEITRLRQLAGRPDTSETFRDERLGLGESLAAGGKSVSNIAAGLIGQAVGGVAGLAASPLGFIEGQEGVGAGVSQGVQEAIGGALRFEDPATQKSEQLIGRGIESASQPFQEGAANLAALAKLQATLSPTEALKTRQEILQQGTFKSAGQAVLEETGSPLAATIAEVGPQAALELFFLRGQGGNLIKQSAAKEDIKQILQSSSPNPAAASSKLRKSIITGVERVVKDKTARKAINQGFNEPAVISVKTGNKADQAKAIEMIKVVEEMKSDAFKAQEIRPSNVLGDSMFQRFDFVVKRNKSIGKKLDVESKNLANKKLDANSVLGKMVNDLKKEDVIFDSGLNPNFSGSQFVGPDRMVVEVLGRLKESKSALQLHKLKRFIDKQVTFGKSTQSGIEVSAAPLLKRVRHNIDQLLDSKFSSYKKVNDDFSETIRAVEAFKNIAGNKVDLFRDSGKTALGTLFRRISSNAESRGRIAEAVNDIEAVAARQGKKFNDSLMRQKILSDELTSVFKIQPKTALKNEIIEAGRSMTKGGITTRAIDKAVDLLFGPNEEKALRAIKQLVKESN